MPWKISHLISALFLFATSIRRSLMLSISIITSLLLKINLKQRSIHNFSEKTGRRDEKKRWQLVPRGKVTEKSLKKVFGPRWALGVDGMALPHLWRLELFILPCDFLPGISWILRKHFPLILNLSSLSKLKQLTFFTFLSGLNRSCQTIKKVKCMSKGLSPHKKSWLSTLLLHEALRDFLQGIQISCRTLPYLDCSFR